MNRTPLLIAFGASTVAVVVSWFLKRRKMQKAVLVQEPAIAAAGSTAAAGAAGSDEVDPMPKRRFQRRFSVSAECGQTPEKLESAKRVVYDKTPEERAAITAVIKNNVLFQGVSEDQLAEVVDSMYPCRYKPGDNVIVQGETGNEFFVVLDGEYEFLKSPGEGQPAVRVGKTGKGGAFGELALMYGAPRAATVRCIGAGPHVLWATDRATFTRVLMRFFSSQRERHEGFLNQVPLFQKAMDRNDRLRLTDAFESVEFKRGESVVREGEPGSAFFVIEQGEADVIRGGKVVNHLKPGDYFGEVAVLRNQPRLASVVATTPVLKLAKLEADAFDRLMPDPVRKALEEHARSYSSTPM